MWQRVHENEDPTVPSIVDMYNKHMGGIDKGDQILYCHLGEHKSLKSTTKVIFNVLCRMMMNLYVLYMAHGTNARLSRHEYVVQIIGVLGIVYKPDNEDEDIVDNYTLQLLGNNKEKDCLFVWTLKIWL